MLRFSLLAAIVVLIGALAWWLELPKSVMLMAQGVGEQRRPVDFEVEFVGIDPNVLHVPVRLFYTPKTPIFGISAHYWSSIAPLRIDTVTRTLDIHVHGGRVRWSAPLGLAGFSNFRLQSVQIGEAGARYALEATTATDPSTDPSKPPRSLDVPRIAVSRGAYRYDGALALWRRTENGETNPYVYSPRIDSVPPQAMWDGLRVFRARVDLTAYPIGTFVVPGGWAGNGWKNEGFRLTRPHASLTDEALRVSAGIPVPLPFARECASPPQFAAVAGSRIPPWSRIDGLWRPVTRAVWKQFLRSARAPELDTRFVPGTNAGVSLDRVEYVTVLSPASGRYRLFAACRNPHYGSLGVTWIDVIVRPVVTAGGRAFVPAAHPNDGPAR